MSNKAQERLLNRQNELRELQRQMELHASRHEQLQLEKSLVDESRLRRQMEVAGDEERLRHREITLRQRERQLEMEWQEVQRRQRAISSLPAFSMGVGPPSPRQFTSSQRQSPLQPHPGTYDGGSPSKQAGPSNASEVSATAVSTVVQSTIVEQPEKEPPPPSSAKSETPSKASSPPAPPSSTAAPLSPKDAEIARLQKLNELLLKEREHTQQILATTLRNPAAEPEAAQKPLQGGSDPAPSVTSSKAQGSTSPVPRAGERSLPPGLASSNESVQGSEAPAASQPGAGEPAPIDEHTDFYYRRSAVPLGVGLAPFPLHGVVPFEEVIERRVTRRESPRARVGWDDQPPRVWQPSPAPSGDSPTPLMGGGLGPKPPSTHPSSTASNRSVGSVSAGDPNSNVNKPSAATVSNASQQGSVPRRGSIAADDEKAPSEAPSANPPPDSTPAAPSAAPSSKASDAKEETAPTQSISVASQGSASQPAGSQSSQSQPPPAPNSTSNPPLTSIYNPRGNYPGARSTYAGLLGHSPLVRLPPHALPPYLDQLGARSRLYTPHDISPNSSPRYASPPYPPRSEFTSLVSNGSPTRGRTFPTSALAPNTATMGNPTTTPVTASGSPIMSIHERAQLALTDKQGSLPVGARPTARQPQGSVAFQKALQNLREFGKDLGVDDLIFDDNYTAVVAVEDDFNLMVTFDPDTAGLYLYSPLVQEAALTKQEKLTLYEELLQGALLGREMAGGTVGLTKKTNNLMLSTCIDMRISTASALRTIAPIFADCVQHWRNRVAKMLGRPVDIHPVSPTQASASPPGSPSAARAFPQGGYSPRDGSPTPASLASPVWSPRSSTLFTPSVPTRSEQGTVVASPSQASTKQAHAVIGMEITDGVTVNGQFRRYTDGVVVVNVKGPAAKAGIQPNDIVIKVNSSRVTSLGDFQKVAQTLAPGSTATFTLDRHGSLLNLGVHLDSTVTRPGNKKYKNIVKIAVEKEEETASKSGSTRATPQHMSPARLTPTQAKRRLSQK
eukprot:TRINITY_DN62487_c0_g2_i1.p1 TRINITY_DN62487_c0_g2~~TRINITY_DN62487_c0_g2_i1.p1  ORF type:complete len:1014 (+),score=104.94 TRINITY_DN62487_c0_g2_i1:44-3085(+)